MTTTSTKPARKRERSTSLTLTLPSKLATAINADARLNVRTPQQQAVYVLLTAYGLLQPPQPDQTADVYARVSNRWVSNET